MPNQAYEHPTWASTGNMYSPATATRQVEDPLEITLEYVGSMPGQASSESVTSTGDGSDAITIQGDEGASPAVAVLAFVAPLLIVAVALGAVYQLLRLMERRRG